MYKLVVPNPCRVKNCRILYPPKNVISRQKNPCRLILYVLFYLYLPRGDVKPLSVRQPIKDALPAVTKITHKIIP